ncbi:unnamed protein product [Symbiodinium sp. KB8]|nr:unnamed protein product [Symbiodinium sp. KB8]
MLGFVAASGIVSEPQARASREDVIRHFNAAGAAIGTARSSAQTVRPCFAGMISCCAVLSTTRARRARDASDPEHGEATIYIKDEAVRICHSIYGPVPGSDGAILQHGENVYNIQMHGMQGRIDAEGFHCCGYVNPIVAAPPPASPEPKVSRQPVTRLQKACRNLAAILGREAFSKEDYQSMRNEGSASNALLSEIKAMGDDYGGWAAFEANRGHEESSEQQVSSNQWRQLRREIQPQFFVPGAGHFFPKEAYDSWHQQQNARWLPTVTELRATGYMLKHFAQLETEANDAADGVRQTLLTGPEPFDVKWFCHSPPKMPNEEPGTRHCDEQLDL